MIFNKIEYEKRDLFGVVESLDAVEAKPDWEQLAHLQRIMMMMTR